jgi:hypothetical protein
MNCPHQPARPSADAPDYEAARVVGAHPEQGWSLLRNGVVVFEDTGDLLPDGRIIAPHRAGSDLDLVPSAEPAARRRAPPDEYEPVDQDVRRSRSALAGEGRECRGCRDAGRSVPCGWPGCSQHRVS